MVLKSESSGFGLNESCSIIYLSMVLNRFWIDLPKPHICWMDENVRHITAYLNQTFLNGHQNYHQLQSLDMRECDEV